MRNGGWVRCRRADVLILELHEVRGRDRDQVGRDLEIVLQW